MRNLIDRRRLLQSTSAGLAALCLPIQLGLGQASQSAMKFGLVTYLWGKDMRLGELLTVCEKSQCLGVELRTEHAHGVEPNLTEQEREEVRRAFADSPVELVGYGSNCEYHSPDADELKANIELTKAYVRLMHDCGGSGVKVKPNTFPPGVPRAKTIEQIGRALNQVAAYGEGYGQKIRVEVHGRGTSELSAIRDIFQVADHPNVYVCWNSNEEDLAGPGLAANFQMVQERLGDTVHVRELNEGDYPYDELMELFKGIQYEGWILLEARTDPADKVAALIEQRQIFEKLANG